MAEGFAKHYGKELLEARSGGTNPAETVSSKSVEAMKEIGIDISQQFPKELDFDYAKASDLVIVMGCGAEKMCPAWLVSKSENWDLEDTKGEALEFHQKVRDQIKERILELIERIKTGNL
ncbi:MAG: arsenate reductase ArsC [Candidatus Heimdallarchaeota archaeon]|nr:arsenate reductase ArsC [Candidatus Heimdallarchaeota archaeon]